MLSTANILYVRALFHRTLARYLPFARWAAPYMICFDFTSVLCSCAVMQYEYVVDYVVELARLRIYLDELHSQRHYVAMYAYVVGRYVVV